MADPVEFLGAFNAGDTPVVDFPILDDTDAAFKPTDLYVMLYDEASGATINGRDGSANQIAAYSDADAKVIFELAPADCVLLNTKLAPLDETHRLIFRWTWQGGLKEGSRVYNFTVRSRRAPADQS